MSDHMLLSQKQLLLQPSLQGACFLGSPVSSFASLSALLALKALKQELQSTGLVVTW